MTWTDQKIEMLKDLWGQHSASEIAEMIGGLTRNAVIGKANRMKLSAQKDKAVAIMARTSGASKGIGRKRMMLRPLPSVPVPATPLRALPQPQREAQNRDMFRSLEGIGTGRIEGIPVTKAGERHCRWPVGDPRSADFRFCGCTASEGLPYCVDHARIAYQSVGRRMRNKTTLMEEAARAH